jgi:hypothetical protein
VLPANGAIRFELSATGMDRNQRGWTEGHKEKDEVEKIKHQVKETNSLKRLLRGTRDGSPQLKQGSKLPWKSLGSQRNPNFEHRACRASISQHGMPILAGLNQRESTLLMHYLDYVFPLQFHFYKPLPTN